MHLLYADFVKSFKLLVLCKKAILGIKYCISTDFNCTGTPGITGCMGHLIHNRSLISQARAWFMTHGHEFWEWVKHPGAVTTTGRSRGREVGAQREVDY